MRAAGAGSAQKGGETMAFHTITPAELGREKEFGYFTQEAPCSFSFSTELDVTALYAHAKAANVRFFPCFLHCLTAEVNARRDFRMAERAEGLGWFDRTHPFYTVFHEEDKRFSNVWTEYDENFSVFYGRYLRDRAEYGGAHAAEDKPCAEGNVFNVSCIPWASFTGFSLNLPESSHFFSPIFTVGQYFLRGRKRLLPFAVQVHHAVCDGWHVAMFVNALQARLNTFSASQK